MLIRKRVVVVVGGGVCGKKKKGAVELSTLSLSLLLHDPYQKCEREKRVGCLYSP